jgi:hypothetical protein
MTTTHLGDSDNTFTALAAGDQVYGDGRNDALTAAAGGSQLFGGFGRYTERRRGQ